MTSTLDFVDFLSDQLACAGPVRYRKMFGEYCVYFHEKPLFLICDNTVYVKKLPELLSLLGSDPPTGIPYPGASERYILDLEDPTLTRRVAHILNQHTPPPRPKKRKTPTSMM